MAIESPSPSPLAGEGQPARSDGRERGRRKLMRDRAKGMRHEATPAEHRLWQILRAKRFAGYKFRRQLPVDHYITDFACLARRLIVEADGGQHGGEMDARRDSHLAAQGFRVLRFWNSDIFDHEEGVTQQIFDALQSPLPSGALRLPPSPARGEGLGATNG